MAENENGQERSEQATGKRLQESRDKGEVAGIGCGFLFFG